MDEASTICAWSQTASYACATGCPLPLVARCPLICFAHQGTAGMAGSSPGCATSCRLLIARPSSPSSSPTPAPQVRAEAAAVYGTAAPRDAMPDREGVDSMEYTHSVLKVS